MNEYNNTTPQENSPERAAADSNESLRPATRRRRMIVFAATAVILLAALTTVALLWQPWEASHDEHEHAAGEMYTCPMHPQVMEPEPGICPICFMDLVPVSSGGDDDAAENVDVDISPRGRIIADVETAEVVSRRFPSTIVVPASVDYNEATYSAVTSRFRGRIEELFVDRTGAWVRSGEPLMRIYSPDLLTAQQEFLVAIESEPIELPDIGSIDGSSTSASSDERHQRSVDRWQRMVSSARKKLELYGMSNAQITQLRQRGEVSYETTVFARASGYVTELAVSEGAYVNEGSLLMQLVDLSSVWVIANVYENDAWKIRPGMDMTVSGPALGGEVAHGRVEYVYPEVDPETRTTKVRAVFSNPGLRLKPGMYLTATILVPRGDALAVPASAVIRTGTRNLVYVEVEPNAFEAVEVTLGEKHDGYYEINSGEISAGDEVVEQGGFLIDSERQLRGN